MTVLLQQPSMMLYTFINLPPSPSPSPQLVKPTLPKTRMNSGLMVRDTYTASSAEATSIGTTTGFVSFNYRPRHSAADMVKFAETTGDDAYLIDLQDATAGSSAGKHTGSNNAASLTDSAKAWTTYQWINYKVINLTGITLLQPSLLILLLELPQPWLEVLVMTLIPMMSMSLPPLILSTYSGLLPIHSVLPTAWMQPAVLVPGMQPEVSPPTPNILLPSLTLVQAV